MGIGNFIKSTIHTKFTANITDHKAKVKDLKRTENARNKQLVANLKKEGAALDRNVAMWGKVASGVASAGVAIAALKVGFDEFQKHAILASGTVGVNLKGLQEATHGLVTEMDLLSTAGALMNSDFAITQDQMEDVMGLMVSLRNQTNDFTEVSKELTKAIVEGNTEGLKKFGVIIKGSAGTLEAHTEILRRARRETEKMGDAWKRPGDEMKIAATKMKDASSDIKKSLGEIANALTPVIEKLSQVAKFTFKTLPEGLGRAVGKAAVITGVAGRRAAGGQRSLDRTDVQRFSDERKSEQAKLSALVLAADLREKLGISGDESLPKEIGRLKRSIAELTTRISGATKGKGKSRKPSLAALFPEFSSTGGAGEGVGVKGKKRELFEGEGVFRAMESIVSPLVDEIITQMQVEAAAAAQGQAPGKGRAATLAATGLELPEGTGRSLEEAFQRAAELDALDEKPLIERLLGDETSLQSYTSAIQSMSFQLQALSTVYGAFESASTAALDAWIMGEESYSAAFKRAIGNSLRNVAMEMQVQAVKEGAFSLARLAIGDLAGAGQHAAAAAAFQGGALLAGKAAIEMGVRGPPKGKDPEVPVAPQGGGGARTFNVFVGEGFEDDSPRRRAARLRAAVEAAERDGGSQGTVEF